ncbi:MAG: polysaccharide deacetylase family protein, partial [Bacillota bacterium]
TVYWFSETRTAVNGHSVETVTVSEQAYAPVRPLATILGCWLEWDEAAYTVTLSNGIQRIIVSSAAASPVQPGGGSARVFPTGPEPGDKSGAGIGNRGVDPQAARGLASSGPPLVPPGRTDTGTVATGAGQAGNLPSAVAGTLPAGIVPLPGSTILPGGAPPGTAPRAPGERVVRGRIALTFDDGPDSEYTPKILETLAAYRVKATFFFIGWRVQKYPDIARQVASAGHEIGNHGFSHSRLTTLSLDEARREISRTQDAIKAAINAAPRWFRPPYGSYNEDVRRLAKEEGAAMVLWTLSPEDWRTPGEASIVKRVTSAAKDGAIVLLHVRDQTSRALPALIEELTTLGYDLVGLSDVLPASKAKPAGGAKQESGSTTPATGTAGQGPGGGAGPMPVNHSGAGGATGEAPSNGNPNGSASAP